MSAITAAARELMSGGAALYEQDIIAWSKEQVGLLQAGRLSELDINRERRSRSWQVTIRTQRNSIERRMRRTPSLDRSIRDPDWWADVWDDALDAATRETGIEDLPQTCPWQAAQVLDHGWLP